MRRRFTSDERFELAPIRAELRRLVEKRLGGAFIVDEEVRYRILLDREKELLLRPL